MSRWTDADALIADLDKGLWGKDYDKALAEAIISDAPSIDIVRCEECKHWDRERAKRNSIQFMGYCILHSGYCSGDKYCAWGERRSDGQTL